MFKCVCVCVCVVFASCLYAGPVAIFCCLLFIPPEIPNCLPPPLLHQSRPFTFLADDKLARKLNPGQSKIMRKIKKK